MAMVEDMQVLVVTCRSVCSTIASSIHFPSSAPLKFIDLRLIWQELELVNSK